ncbi:Hpt domain-containing response regulator [Granulicella sibirica]|nr:response regulator [Granulicella sibirica]
MSAPETPKRILIIDDDELSRDVLTLLLEAQGYLVDSAISGDHAIEHAVLPAPDLILTDFQMPGLAGNPLAARLRGAYGVTPRLYAMSATRPSPAEIDAYDGFILKPFSPEELEETLQSGKLKSDPSSANTNEESSSPALNEEIFSKLHDFMSTSEVLQMYTFCLQDAYSRLERMRTYERDHNETLYRREAHNIKGGCGMLGATELREIAGTMETLGIADGTTEKNSLREQFLAASERLERILKARAGSPSIA